MKGSGRIGWIVASTCCALMGFASAMAAPEGEGSGIRAELLYHNYCSVCHGDRGDGRSRARNSLVPPPLDFTAASGMQRPYMLQVVAEGKPGTAMVGWKTQLNPREIEAVVDFIRDHFMSGKPQPQVVRGVSGMSAHGGKEQDQALALRVDMSLPFPGGLKGRAEHGRTFYEENCATCHGKLGDGQGPRAHFIRPRPRSFVSPASRTQLNRPALYAGVAMGRLGTEMPAWSKVLDEQQIADVAEYVFQRFTAPDAPGGR